MKVDCQRAITVPEMKAFSNLVEDICSDPSCGMTILVEPSTKSNGCKSYCPACLMLAKTESFIK